MAYSTIILILAIICIIGAVVLTIKPWWVAAVPALAGLLLLHFGQFIDPIALPTWKLIMWVVATVIVVGIRLYQPAGEPDGRNTGNLYIGLAALAGAILGVALGSNYVLLCTIIGAVLGMMAYSRTPNGKWISFANSTFIPYFCARCLPAIVAVAQIGMCAEALIFYFVAINKPL